MENQKKITKRHNHDHFWIEEEVLYESYNTIRGIRFNKVLDIKGFHHCGKVDEHVIELIEQVYLKEEIKKETCKRKGVCMCLFFINGMDKCKRQ